MDHPDYPMPKRFELSAKQLAQIGGEGENACHTPRPYPPLTDMPELVLDDEEPQEGENACLTPRRLPGLKKRPNL